jgi:glycosyltransferase involved in cell wall biosynthesis
MKISVITINLNNLNGLKKTIESVYSQTFKDFEYIIIDGDSNDGSKEFIGQYANTPFPFRWISEKDKGIYNAMNKGLQIANGEYVHFLNSGDFLVNNKVYEELIQKSTMTLDIIYGNKIEVYSDGHEVLNKGLQKSNLTFDDAYRGCISHSSAFTKRCLFEKYGLFDESFKIVSDTEFYLKAIGLGCSSTEYVDFNVSYFDMNGVSKNPSFKFLQQTEFENMKRTVLSNELVESYEFFKQFGYKIERINKKKWSAFLFRLLHRIAYMING